jgi:hypothetical protein
MRKTFRDMLVGVILGNAHLGRTGENKAFITFFWKNHETNRNI